MDAAQLQALAHGITGLVQDIRNDDAIHKAAMHYKNKITDQAKTIKPCDGGIPADVREYLEDIELSIPILDGVPNGTIELVTRTVVGSLRKEVQRFLATQPNRLATNWNILRNHICRTFLSANEGEKSKIELEKITQPSYETIPMFNRKFREIATKAYPQPRTQDAERVIIRAYARALYDSSIARKLITEGNPADIEAALAYMEQVAAGMELFDNIERKRRDEPMEIGVVQATSSMCDQLNNFADVLTTLKKQNEKVMTRIAKLEAQHVGQRPGPVNTSGLRNRSRWTKDQKPICDHCGKVGHMKRECYQRKGMRNEQGN